MNGDETSAPGPPGLAGPATAALRRGEDVPECLLGGRLADARAGEAGQVARVASWVKEQGEERGR